MGASNQIQFEFCSCSGNIQRLLLQSIALPAQYGALSTSVSSMS